MPFSEQPTVYTKIPARTPAATLALTRALIEAAPARPQALVKLRLAELRERGLALQAAWIAISRPARVKISKRVFDERVDRAWRVVRQRNLDWVALADEEHADQAAEADGLLFPTQLDFLLFKYIDEWAESEKRLKLIAADDLEEGLAERIGERFMTELREAHAAYGEILGITRAPEPELNPERVAGALLDARRALGAYARLVHALAERGDDEEIAAAEAQLAPIVRFRAQRATAETTQDEEEEEEEEEAIEVPLPELPAGEAEGGEQVA